MGAGRSGLDALHRLAAFAAVLLLEQRVQRFAQILRFNARETVKGHMDLLHSHGDAVRAADAR